MSYLDNLEKRLHIDQKTFEAQMKNGAIAIIYPNNSIGYLAGLSIDNIIGYSFWSWRFRKTVVVVEYCKDEMVCWGEFV